MQKRFVSLLLTLAMVLAMIPAFAISVSAEGPKAEVNYSYPIYVDETDPSKGITSWNVGTIGGSNEDYIEINEDKTTDQEWGSGWYVVTANVTYPAIHIDGDAKLILKEDCELICTKSISLDIVSSLTIYGQENGAGSLKVIGSNSGITTDFGCKIIVNGGTLTITNNSTSGVEAMYSYGNIIVNDGVVSATVNGNGNGNVGIHASSNLTINGGTVLGDSGNSTDGYGISTTNLTVNAGTVSGISSGYGISVTNIAINSGIVEATGGEQAIIGTVPNQDKLFIRAGVNKYSATEVESYTNEKYAYLALAICKIGETKYPSIKNALAANHDNEDATSPTSIKLIHDDIENVEIPTGRNIILDLNGFVLDSNCDFGVISVGGKLSIKDSNPNAKHYFTYSTQAAWTYEGNMGSSTTTPYDIDENTASGTSILVKGGCITGGEAYSNGGGGIYIDRNATVYMFAGNIVGNKGDEGGGVVNERSLCSFHMYGGSVIGNEADNGGGIYNEYGLTEILGGSVMFNISNKGGGIYNCDNATLFISGGAIENNTAIDYGGGIYNASGCVGISEGIIKNNISNCAGGIYNNNDGTLTITGGSIESNLALVDNGGGIENHGELYICEATIKNNEAKNNGGGIENYGGSEVYYGKIIITGGSIENNTASRFGGGIYNENDGTITINSVMINSNTGCECGGGILNNKGFIIINDSTIKNNKASSYSGGGAYNESRLLVTASEVSYNTATWGGGIYNDGDLLISDVAIKNNKALWGGAINNSNELYIHNSSITDNTITTSSGVQKVDFGGAGIDFYAGNITLFGKVIISNNKTNGIQDNVFMEFDDNNTPTYNANTPIVISSSGLGANSVIGITHYMSAATAPIKVASYHSNDYSSYFVSDDNQYIVGRNSTDGCLYLDKNQSIVNPTTPEYYDDPTINIPVTGDKGTVKVSATVSGKTSTINNIPVSEIEKAGTGDVVTIDLASLNKNVSGVNIPKKTFENITNSNAKGLEIKLPNATLVFDKKAVDAVTEQAEGNYIKLVVDKDKQAEQTLSEAQKEAIKEFNEPTVLDAYFVSNGLRISDFKGGKADIKSGYETTNPVKVWYVADNGDTEYLPSTFDGKVAMFTVYHFSHYVIENLEPDAYKDCPQDETCVYAKFIDSNTRAWYHGGVHFCTEWGYIDGEDPTHFNPNGTLTRGMMVRLIYNFEGRPSVKEASTFTDVATGRWFTDAIAWAQDYNVVEGVGNNMFKQGDILTREQLATLFYKYAKYKGINTDVLVSIDNYSDADKVSRWATDAFKWAVANGIVEGSNGKLNPKGLATRAEAAVLLKNFCETFGL